MPYPFLKRWMRLSALTKSRHQKRFPSECVELSAFASRWHDCIAGLAAATGELVPASSLDDPMRAAARRLAMSALGLPLLIAAGLVSTLAETLGSAKIVALVALVIGGGWLALSALRFGGRRYAVELVLLALLSVAGAAIVAGAGGPASPLALLLVAPFVEAVWVRRDRRAAIAGAVASLGGLLLQAGFAATLAPAAGGASAWHWLLPAVYLATVAARAATFVGERERLAAASRPVAAEDVIDAAVIRLARGGEVLEAAGKAGELLELMPSLLFGNGLFERIHVGDRVGWLCALSDLRDGAASRKLEVRIRAPRSEAGEETYRHFAVEIAAAGDRDGALIAVLRPNDELAALRAEVSRLKAGAEQVDVAKSRFLGVVSHELRTPLNAIIGFSDMLAEEMFGPFADARQKEYAGLIREAGNHLLAVVTSILDVSKIACGSYPIDPQPFRFADAVDVCRKMISLQAAEKSLALETEIAPSAGRIVADRRAVQQMLINLMANAVKFTPAGGTVTVGANRLGSRLHFWVSDTGIGIKEEDLCRLGRPFTQVRNDYTRDHDGAGLGLSLVKGLVELHEGAMMIESAPGEGTVVTISLPVAGPPRAVAQDQGNVIQLKNDEVADGQARKIA
jgi:cell cycle sensor histidine kinase DivJ